MKEGTYYLKPGYLFASRDPLAVSTVLGSCVAVCLFDRRRGVGGINHYLQPRASLDTQRSTRFGNVAVSALVSVLKEWGCQAGDLEAAVIGGASMEHSSTSEWVAKQNIEVALSVLSARGIALVYEETGGYRGRKVLFHTVSGRLEWTFLPKGDWID